MKKLIFIIAFSIAFFCATAFRAAAQEKGDWTLGVRTGLYTHTGDGAKYAVGLTSRYNPVDGLRIEPAVLVVIGHGCSVDVSFNVHYTFNLTRKNNMWLYPIVGIGVNEVNRWSMGINLGAGYDWDFNRHWAFTAEVLYVVQTARYIKNPIVPQVGVSYKF